MSTLHQYRWIDFRHCQQYLNFIDDTDALMIYGQFTAQDQQRLLKKAPFLADRCYWLSDAMPSISGYNHINHGQWLTLITQHDKTYTWK